MPFPKSPVFFLLAIAALFATAASAALLASPLGAAVGASLAFAATAEAALRREHRRVLTLAFVVALGLGLLVGHGGGALPQWAVFAVALGLVGELIGARAARLHHGAVTDPLTGLLNREGLREAAARAVVGCRKDRLPLTVVHLDLDHFKEVNDNFGHASGDSLLRACAESWSAALADGEALARVGGDEFLLLLPGSDRPAAESSSSARRRGSSSSPKGSSSPLSSTPRPTPKVEPAAAEVVQGHRLPGQLLRTPP